MRSVKFDDLKLGMTIKVMPDDCPYNSGIVFRIDKKKRTVLVERPYMMHADFEYTGGVIVYIGHEEVTMFDHGRTEFLVESEPARPIR